jgi:hypothetical protein
MLSNGRMAAVGVLIAMAVLPPPLAAQDSPSRAAPTVRAVRGTIRVDGRLDDLLYGTTDAIESFVQQEPDEGKPATEKTEAWVFFDDDMIYVAARCWESRRERRVANEMRRDTNQLRQNDTFAVLFDTFHDRRNGYLFTANAIGGMGDSQITDEGPPNVDWNTVWTFETAEFDEGWTVEMAIPFKSLRYQSGREQTWGINLRRVVRWKNEWSYLAQVPRALTTFRGILKVSSAGTLVGLQAPSGTHMIELKPYALSGVASDTTVTPPLSNDVTKRIGGDLKYGVTQNLTADVTINTDFAQVEVDEQQVNLTRFNLFFPEKRDFFLENLGTFAFAGRASAGLGAGSGVTPYLFFSRRIGLDVGRVPPLRRRRTTERQDGALHDRSAQRPYRRSRSSRRAIARHRTSDVHRCARQARHSAPEQHRCDGHAPHRDTGSRWLESGLRPRRDVLVLSERARRYVRGRHADGRPTWRRSQLPRPLRLQRRSLRVHGGATGGRAQLPSRDRVPATNRYAAQLRADALQPAPDADTARAQIHHAGEHQLSDKQSEQAGYARACWPVSN